MSLSVDGVAMMGSQHVDVEVEMRPNLFHGEKLKDRETGCGSTKKLSQRSSATAYKIAIMKSHQNNDLQFYISIFKMLLDAKVRRLF